MIIFQRQTFVYITCSCLRHKNRLYEIYIVLLHLFIFFSYWKINSDKTKMIHFSSGRTFASLENSRFQSSVLIFLGIITINQIYFSSKLIVRCSQFEYIICSLHYNTCVWFEFDKLNIDLYTISYNLKNVAHFNVNRMDFFQMWCNTN